MSVQNTPYQSATLDKQKVKLLFFPLRDHNSDWTFSSQIRRRPSIILFCFVPIFTLMCMCHKMSRKKGVKLTKFRQAQEQWWFCECSWVFISARLASCPAGHILSLLSRVPPTYSNITAMISPPPPPCCALSVPCFVFFSLFFVHCNSLSHCLFLSLLSRHVPSSASITDNQTETCTVLCEMRFRTIHVEAGLEMNWEVPIGENKERKEA